MEPILPWRAWHWQFFDLQGVRRTNLGYSRKSKPSSLFRIEFCPQSAYLEQKVPYLKDFASLEGQRLADTNSRLEMLWARNRLLACHIGVPQFCLTLRFDWKSQLLLPRPKSATNCQQNRLLTRKSLTFRAGFRWWESQEPSLLFLELFWMNLPSWPSLLRYLLFGHRKDA